MNSLVLIIVFPLIFAFLVPIFKGLGKYASRITTMISLLIGLILAIFFYTKVQMPFRVILGGWKPPFGIVLVGDHVSLLFAIFIYIFAFLNLFFVDKDFKENFRFYMLYNIVTAGVIGLTLTGDIFNMFVFIEITGIALYSLIASSKKKSALTGSLKYLFVGSMTSMLLLLGVGIAYHVYGNLNLAQIAKAFNSQPYNLRFLILALIFTGLLVEAEIFPFNTWVPNSYKGSYIPITVFLASIASIAMAYLMFRYRYLYNGMHSFTNMLIWFGVFTVVIGEFSAFFTYDLKKILAYSSIGQMGLILLAVGISTRTAIYGGFYQILAHSFAKFILFFIIGFIIYEMGTNNVKKLSGFGKNHPYLAGFFVVASLSLAGIPGLMGFWGKFSIIGAAVKNHHTVAAIIVLLAAIAEGVYLLRIAYYLFKNDEEKVVEKKKVPVLFGIVLIILVASIIVIGVYPQSINGMITKATQAIIDSGKYITTVLG